MGGQGAGGGGVAASAMERGRQTAMGNGKKWETFARRAPLYLGAGEWKETEIILPTKYSQAEERGAMLAAGWEEVEWLGSGGGDPEWDGWLRVWCVANEDAKRYLVEVSTTGDGSTALACDGLPAALELIGKLQPIVMRAWLMERGERFFTTIFRAFHVWHGHYGDEACRECDPSIAGRKGRE